MQAERAWVGVTEAKAAFADGADHAECRRLHRRYGTTYYFATCRMPRRIRRRVHALYGFVRVPDEWVDNSPQMSLSERSERLAEWRREFLRGIDGVRPGHPVLRAFCDVAQEAGLGVEEPLRFLDAMERDLAVARYATYAELREYMRGSAATVGLMMCRLMEVASSPEVDVAAVALAEAMQLTNFLRDVREDAERGRVYLPLEDLETFGVAEADLLGGPPTAEFRRLMRFEMERARALYAIADAGIPLLPRSSRRAVSLARILYARILDRIEAMDCDVFHARARVPTPEKLAVAARVSLLGR
jgi:15-cis-phytoene synthase